MIKLFASLAAILTFCSLLLGANKLERKGSFGVVINNNFVHFSYVLTYLGESYKEGYIAFRLDFEDNKGFDLTSEIDESETVLKNLRNQKLKGKIERKTASTAVILFPKKEDYKLSGKTRLTTSVMGYKLRKTFKLSS